MCEISLKLIGRYHGHSLVNENLFATPRYMDIARFARLLSSILLKASYLGPAQSSLIESEILVSVASSFYQLI